MAIIYKSDSENTVLNEASFKNEAELQDFLGQHPEILKVEGDPHLQFVDREVPVSSGNIDLLYVNGNGDLLVVETKLRSNPESRREVVAQVLDYLSSLSELAINDLDQRVDGRLEKALESIAIKANKPFEELWNNCAAKLKAGAFQVAVVLDGSPDDLRRIMEYLAAHINLELRLITIGKFEKSKSELLYVPSVAVLNSKQQRSSKPTNPVLQSVTQAYDTIAEPALRTIGKAWSFRQIPALGAPARVHFEFLWDAGRISAEIHFEQERENFQVASLAVKALLEEWKKTKKFGSDAEYVWKDKWYRGFRVGITFPPTVAPQLVVSAMITLIPAAQKILAAHFKGSSGRAA